MSRLQAWSRWCRGRRRCRQVGCGLWSCNCQAVQQGARLRSCLPCFAAAAGPTCLPRQMFRKLCCSAEHLIAQQQQAQQQQPPQQQLPVPAPVGQQPAALSEQRLAAGVVPQSRDPRARPAQPAAHEPTLLLSGAAAQGVAAPQQPDLAQQPAFLGDILQQLAQELAGSGRLGGGEAGAAALLPALSMDLERSGSGVELSELTVSGLPPDATHGGVATFFRYAWLAGWLARPRLPAPVAGSTLPVACESSAWGRTDCNR